MKRAILLPALVSVPLLFAAAPAFAQTLTLEPLEPGVAPDSPKVESRPKAKPVSRSRRMGRANADARHCLDLQSNTAIIKCAERYL
jgi:hypothetical protein